jgi:hypothetical protein
VELFVHGISKPDEVLMNKVAWKQWVHEDGVLYFPKFVWKGNEVMIEMK